MSDLSYLQRGVSTGWTYIWFIIYVFRWDRFGALSLRRLGRFELRSIVTILVLISLGLQLAYDLGSARLKYIEGFWINPHTQEIQSKPAQAWSGQDIEHVEPLYYTLACALALETCVFFLLQAFWSYISKSVTKSCFMTSFEFKVNIAASCIVVAIFPTVQYLFRNDFVYREVIPQMIFSILMFITGILGIRTHFRLVALIKNAGTISSETTLNVLQKLEYFKDMNVVLTFSFFGCAFPLSIMSVDGLLNKPLIAEHKFGSDFLITNLNFFEFIIWVTLTLIFYPRKTVTGSHFGSTNMDSQGRNARQSGETHLPRFNTVKPQDDDYHRKPLHPMHYDLDNDPVWNNEVISVGNSQRKNQHNRTLSNDSRQATLVPMVPIITTPPTAAAVAKTCSTSLKLSNKKAANGNMSNNLSVSNDRAEVVSNTIYYQDGLAKAQQQFQQQQQQQDSGHETPNRSFSQNSQHSVKSSQRVSDNIPQRSSSQRPLVPKSNKNYTRHTPNNSADYTDYRPSREYPSLTHETSPNHSDNNHATLSSGNYRHQQQQYHPHYAHQTSMYNDDKAGMTNNTRAASALAQRNPSEESDRSLIQIGYIRPMEIHEAQAYQHTPLSPVSLISPKSFNFPATPKSPISPKSPTFTSRGGNSFYDGVIEVM
ncbi:hypothetical protein BX616_003186 [Lobosporangium transversale]|nr:hypothetical protein BX616_003186 [Lobosporangium transversale]